MRRSPAAPAEPAAGRAAGSGAGPATAVEPAVAPEAQGEAQREGMVQGAVPAPASRRPRWLRQGLLALLIALIALLDAHSAGVRGISAVGPALRVVGAATLLFGLCGFPVVRVALPASLRAHSTLWVLPTGACVAACGLTALGYAGVPFRVSLAGMLAAGAAATVVVLVRGRRAGADGHARADAGHRPASGRWLTEILWPLFVACLIIATALLPMFRAGRPTVLGGGSDAHLAVGTAQFLEHNYPTSTDPNQPVNKVPLVWRSKPPIYYGLAAVSTLARLPTYFAMASMAAFLLGLAVLGIFVLSAVALRAPPAAALAAMALVGLDRMVLHTVMHPYFNQTWGFALMPWAMLIGVAVLRAPSRRGLALAVLFLATVAFAYPLALPIPLIFVAGAGWRLRRERAARGEPVASWRSGRLRGLYRGRRSLAWMVPVGLILVIPVLGVAEKLFTGLQPVLGGSLAPWAGDLAAYFPEPQFFALDGGPLWPLLVVGMAGAAIVALRRAPRPSAWGMGAVLIFALVATVVFRLRTYGYYFHFKVLAFCAPLLLCCAAAGLARLRRTGAVLLGSWVLAAPAVALAEIGQTFDQLQLNLLGLRDFSRAVPPGASIRLDVQPGGVQLWAAYLLAPHPLCSQEPLANTSYPHVPVSRKAGYVLVWQRPNFSRVPLPQPPFDSLGPPIKTNDEWALYRMNPAVPGPDTCSKLRVQTVTRVTAAS